MKSLKARVHDWRWVPTDLNVADDATRMKTLHLNSSHRWLGLSFIFNSPEVGPEKPVGQLIVQEECKQSSRLVAVHLVVRLLFCMLWPNSIFGPYYTFCP